MGILLNIGIKMVSNVLYLTLFVIFYLATLSLSVPCDSPPLDISSTGCCSQSCWSWDDCLECSYDNYYLCVDQIGDTRLCTEIQDREKDGCYENCYLEK